MSVLNKLTQQVQDANGNFYQLVPIVAETDAAKQAGMIGKVAGYVAARASETNTQIAGVVTPVLASPVIDGVTNAVMAALSGNYLGALQTGVPALLGLGSWLVAILTPESKSTGALSDDQIKTVVSSLSRDQLIGLLEQSVLNESSTHAAAGVSTASTHAATTGTLQPVGTVVQPG